eukprot:CAMPEP_0176134578 /NCGR_PEP_ID=MMETSP0120_2-20121206/68249_1 /TAXON_ID=160619 /ORGANISM="Kryptoperidinium foliaceum, Strain CCMP 1326" /LENGTH=46 /DNA_ID= /DNA_START= /DNA_END= /DNA_ORIENTATION=
MASARMAAGACFPEVGEGGQTGRASRSLAASVPLPDDASLQGVILL